MSPRGSLISASLRAMDFDPKSGRLIGARVDDSVAEPSYGRDSRPSSQRESSAATGVQGGSGRGLDDASLGTRTQRSRADTPAGSEEQHVEADRGEVREALPLGFSPAQGFASSNKGLRRWIRWLARASKLQLSSPDPSLLVKAVDKLAITHLTDASAVFRVQSFRMQHGVEHKPSQASAVSLAQFYLAELETLALAEPEKDTKRQRVSSLQEGAPSGSGEADKAKGKGKEKGKKTKNNADATELCRQFSTDGGCPRGNTCRYKHYSAAGMSGRCFNCGE